MLIFLLSECDWGQHTVEKLRKMIKVVKYESVQTLCKNVQINDSLLWNDSNSKIDTPCAVL